MVLEPENSRQNRMGDKGDESFISIQEKEEDETWANYCTRAARVSSNIRVNIESPFLSKVIAESMWRAMGWVCDERPTAVINALKQVSRWRSTKWWLSTQASGMKSDPYNHTRWKHKCGCIIEGVSGTSWLPSGPVRRDWTSKRAVCYALEDGKRFVTFALGSVNLSTVHRTRTGKKYKMTTRILGPRIKPSTLAKRGRQCNCVKTVTVAGKWINDHFSLGQKYRGRIGQIQKKHMHSWRKNKIVQLRETYLQVTQSGNRTVGQRGCRGTEKN